MRQTSNGVRKSKIKNQISKCKMQNDELKSKEKEKKELLIEKKDVWEEARAEVSLEEKKELEKGKLPVEEEEAIRQQIKREIELMKLTPELQEEAAKKAKKIEFLGEKEKLEHLMLIAKEKGLAFAVKVAENMNDPYVLDVFHDTLVKEGFYKKFLQNK